MQKDTAYIPISKARGFTLLFDKDARELNGSLQEQPKWFHVALRTLVLLASSESMLKSHYIAEQLGEDPTFVRKILSKLSKSDYVKSHGGRYGGYSLNTTPKEISVKGVYQALGDTSPTPFYTVPSTGVEYFISQIIEKAEKSFQEELNQFTIQDLVDMKEKK